MEDGDQKLPDYSSPPRGLKKLLSLKLTRKQLLLWGVLICLFVLYAGGSYYVLSSRNEKVLVDPPPFSSRSSSGGITPSLAATPPQSLTPSPTPTITPTPDPLSTWKTFTNKTYQLRLRYPSKTVRLTGNKTAGEVGPYSMRILYQDTSRTDFLLIDVQDVDTIGQSDLESRRIAALSLQEFATEKWQQNLTYTDPNVPNRQIGTLQTIVFRGKTAYSFTLSGSWNDDRTYAVLPQQYTYIFIEHEGYNLIIVYPTDDTLLKQILDTMVFL